MKGCQSCATNILNVVFVIKKKVIVKKTDRPNQYPVDLTDTSFV